MLNRKDEKLATAAAARYVWSFDSFVGFSSLARGRGEEFVNSGERTQKEVNSPKKRKWGAEGKEKMDLQNEGTKEFILISLKEFSP